MIEFIVGEALKSVYKKYILGILICATRKTCTQMAEAIDTSHDILNRALREMSKNNHGLQKSLLSAALQLLNPKKKWWLILDDSMILKPHAKKLQEAILDYCGATGKVDRGLVAIFLCITDGEIVIPISYKFWINKKNIAPENYRKKWEIGIGLLQELPIDFKHKFVLMDGGYANRFSLKILSDLGFEFEARFRKNSIVIVDGKKCLITEHLIPRTLGPRIYATVHGFWQNQSLYFTAHKHKNHSGEYVITYTVSNHNATAKEHAQAYCIRWGIEIFFRTAKQSLGLQHCASASLNMQIAHINACIIAYVFLQEQRIRNRHSSVEDALYDLRIASKHKVQKALNDSDKRYHAFA